MQQHEVISYDESIQLMFINVLLSNNDVYARSQSILREEHFDSKFRGAVRYVQEYAERNGAVPLIDDMKARFREHQFYKINGVDDPRHSEDLLGQIERFCKHKALENAILEGTLLLEKGHYGEIEQMIKDAMLVSLHKDLGTAYFDDPQTRLKRMKDNNNTESCGLKTIDDKLFGGFNKGGLNIFAGGSGTGKSLFLLNISRYWVMQGKTVLYITLELSEDLIGHRLDSMFTDTLSKDVLKNIPDVSMKLTMLKQRNPEWGDLHVKYMPAQTTSNAIRAYLNEFMIKTGKKPDAIALDYLDLLGPNSSKVNISDQFIKDKYCSEEIRALANEYDLFLVTASQLNRSAVTAANDGLDFDHSHIAGGISKINTADNVMTIYTNDRMREQGQYRIQFIKTRSSSGVGQKVYLGFNPSNLRIFDMDEQPEFDDTPDDTDLFNTERLRNTRETIMNRRPTGGVNMTSDNDLTQKSKLMDLVNKVRG